MALLQAIKQSDFLELSFGQSTNQTFYMALLQATNQSDFPLNFIASNQPIRYFKTVLGNQPIRRSTWLIAGNQPMTS